jgi:hypothetical protein
MHRVEMLKKIRINTWYTLMRVTVNEIIVVNGVSLMQLKINQKNVAPVPGQNIEKKLISGTYTSTANTLFLRSFTL